MSDSSNVDQPVEVEHKAASEKAAREQSRAAFFVMASGEGGNESMAQQLLYTR